MEESLKEKEDSNSLLRKDILNLMSQFSEEKTLLEQNLLRVRLDNEMLRQGLEKHADERRLLESNANMWRGKYERKCKEKRKVEKMADKWKKEVKDVYHNHARAIRLSKLMEQINNLD